MRTVELGDGRKLDVRPMTHRELRGGKELGFGSAACDIKIERFDEACDFAVGGQFPEELDNLSNPDLLLVFKSILAETYSNGDEEKNLSRSGPGARTSKESNVAGSAGAGKTKTAPAPAADAST
jgi:hypothetical protein